MRQNEKTVSPMSNEGRNTYVIERITDALLELMRDKSIEDISISVLCESAGVGRASFYRNFNSKEDILRRYIQNIFQEWMRGDYQSEDKSLSDLLKSIFLHFESHRSFYELLNQRNLIYLLKDVIIRICGLNPEHSKMEVYAKAYVSYTLYGWIEVWFQRGMKETAEEIAELFQNQEL